MEKGLLFIGIVLVSFQLSAQVTATTEYGKKVLLYDNGTWRSADELSITKEPYVFPRPSFKGQLLTTATSRSLPQLILLSAKKNTVTDLDAWFHKNDLNLPVYEVPNTFMHTMGNVPDKTPKSYNGQALVKAIYSNQHHFLIYGNNFSEGRYLLIADSKMNSVQHVLDFTNYVISPSYKKSDREFINQAIQWAVIENNILYISHAHRTYAASSNGMNAYITAIDLSTYKVLWRTAPLVNNALNFDVYKDMIICGYGFTAEADFLYTINKVTGAVAQKIPLKSGPECIIRKGKQVYVRTYDTDYVFKVQ